MGRGLGGPPGNGGGQPGAGPMLFISPSGEPFRGRPGEPYPVAAWFAGADADRDGKLTAPEFVGDAMRFFEVLDRNGDGELDRPEVRRYEEVIAPEILRETIIGVIDLPLTLVQGPGGGGMGGGPPPGGGPPGAGRGRPPGGGPPGGAGGMTMSGAAPYGLLREPQPVAASNLSFASAISADDFRRRARQRFDRLDTPNKGYLELATLPKTLVQLGPRAGGPRRRS